MEKSNILRNYILAKTLLKSNRWHSMQKPSVKTRARPGASEASHPQNVGRTKELTYTMRDEIQYAR
jgi:hypothetical protein